MKRRILKHNGVKHFTDNEVKPFFEAVEKEGNMRDLTIFKTLLFTGLRLSELQGLNVEQVKSRDFLTVVGKGGKERTLPLTPDMKKIFQDFLEWKKEVGESLHPRAPLFKNQKGTGRITARGIQYRVDYYVKKAKLERSFSPHAFRHTVGYALGKKGIPIRVIQKLLGHSNINTTAIYVEPDLDQMGQALGSL